MNEQQIIEVIETLKNGISSEKTDEYNKGYQEALEELLLAIDMGWDGWNH